MAVDKNNRMLGLCFSSPAMVIVMAASDGIKPYLVNDDVSRETVVEYMSQTVQGRKEKVFVVQGVSNLKKLGPKAADFYVVVHDVPELLSCFPESVRIGDAREVEGSWALVDLVDRETLLKRIRWSRYSKPVHPKAIREARAGWVVALPSNAKKVDPAGSINSILERVRENARDELETGIWEFLAGLVDRRHFGAVRRRALNRLKDKDNAERASEFKTLFSTVQRWIESADEGRAVASAYQICAKNVGITAPVAAERVSADLGVLMKLMAAIPPSRRQDFKGWRMPAQLA